MGLNIAACEEIFGISCQSGFHCKKEYHYFWTENFNTREKIQFLILKKEIRSVVSERHETENQREYHLEILLFLVDYEFSNAWTALTFLAKQILLR